MAKTATKRASTSFSTPWTDDEDVRGRQAARKRAAVLEAAAHLFLERGYDSTSLNEIADSLKVTKPTVYYYFKGKDQILLEIFRQAQEDVIGALKAASRLPKSGLEQLREACLGYAEAGNSPFGRCLTLVRVLPLDSAGQKEVADRIRRAEDVIFGIFETGFRDGSIRRMDLKIAYHTVFGALNWLAAWYKEEGPMTMHDIVAAQADILLYGLAGDKAPPSMFDANGRPNRPTGKTKG